MAAIQQQESPGVQKLEVRTQMSVAKLPAGILLTFGAALPQTSYKAEVRGSWRPELGCRWPSCLPPLDRVPGFRVSWSHAGLNRGPYGYWPYALTS